MKGGLLEEQVNKRSKAMFAAKTLYTATGYVILFKVLLQAIPKASIPPVLTLICLKSKLFPVCFVPFCQHQENNNFFHASDDPEALFM